MKSVNVAQLKDGLSGYLKLVKAGEHILIRDRNTPIARLMPLAEGGEPFDDELMALAINGKIRLPIKPLNESIFPEKASQVPTKIIVAALRADRDED